MSHSQTTSIKDQNKSATSSLLKKNIRKFMNNKLAVIGLVVVVLMIAACAIGAAVGVDYNTPQLTAMKKAPSAEHLFGTDTIGRDLFARVLFGGCYSILIGVFCAVASSVIGAVLGAISGYFGGKVDTLLIRISEVFQAFPQLVLVMMIVAIFNKRGLGNLLFIFVITGWMTTFRMVRNEFMSIKGETYVQVCEAFGMSNSRIMFNQILPNVMSPIIVSTTTNVAFFILQEAALSFIGLGVADSTPTWGNILNAAKSISVVTNQWWIWIFPGLAITLFVLAINFLGDGLRDVLDAKQQ
ncbi:MAG: ABC transporter permease [Ruthenibacterium sp.]